MQWLRFQTIALVMGQCRGKNQCGKLALNYLSQVRLCEPFFIMEMLAKAAKLEI